MSYIIRYQPETDDKYPRKAFKRNGKTRIVRTAIIVLALLIGILFREQIADFLIPGDTEMTIATFSEMVASVKNGMPIEEALAAFCRELINADLQ